MNRIQNTIIVSRYFHLVRVGAISRWVKGSSWVRVDTPAPVHGPLEHSYGPHVVLFLLYHHIASIIAISSCL